MFFNTFHISRLSIFAPMIDKSRISVLIFDWGDTLMRDFDLPGPMWKWKKTSVIPGVRESLKILVRDYPLIVATSATHSNILDMRKALKMGDIEKYFSNFFSAVELQVRKPDPQFFLRVLKFSGYEPHEAVMIGNSYEKDIEGAKKAGMQTVWFNENRLQGKFPSADVIIYSMKDLPAIL